MSSVFSTAHLSVAFAMPKSITLGTGVPSCSVTSTFDGFRSRWITPFWCACWTARQTARNNASRSLVVIRLRSQYCVIGAPSMYSITKYGRPSAGRAGVEDPCDVRVVHHRQRLALVVEAGQHLGGIHTELHNLKSHTPANGLALLGQVHGAHAAFAKRTNDSITAEVVITGCRRCCIEGLSSGFFCSGRTIESAQDKTLAGTVRRDRRNPIPLRTEGSLASGPKSQCLF